jgi:thiamine-phosphate diphosphorylase
MLPIVHAVTDSSVVMQRGFIARASSIMRALGPRGALHLRSSKASGRRFFELAERLAGVQNETGCWLIVNDRVDVAVAVGANGIQLASHSLPVADALTVCGGVPVGASIHSVDEAREAESLGASWCVAGTVFETPSHAGRPPARVDFVSAVARAVKIPIIAIGGVTPDDVPILARAGAYGVATIRGAAWDGGIEASAEGGEQRLTRLVPAAETRSEEPVTRYISAYDAGSGSGENHHADGERRPPGDQPE